MKSVILRIELVQPVLVTHPRAGEENSSEAYDYIPGSVLRGALAALYCQSHPGENISEPGSLARDLFFSGRCCFLNGYPALPESGRLLPIPLSWRVEKYEADSSIAGYYDFVVQEETRLESPKSAGRGFVWIDGADAIYHIPDRFEQVHNASLTRGQKKADTSFVYRYEALAAGQTFEAVITGISAADLLKALSLKEGQVLLLGGSRSANYGKTVLRKMREVEDWQEAPQANSASGNQPDPIILTLLSDAILSHTSGRPAPDLDLVLGVQHSAAYAQTQLVGGFNRKWGLPLPQTLAIRAGSVFVYPAGSIAETRLRHLQEEGIGERRVEGFGRVAVNWLERGHYQKVPALTVSKQKHPDALVLSPSSRRLAEKMAERRMRVVLEQNLYKALENLEITNPPQNSQISRLRQAVQQAANQGVLEIIPAHVRSLKSAKDQLKRARVIDWHLGEKNEYRLGEWLDQKVIIQPKNGPVQFPIWEEHLLANSSPVRMAGIEVTEQDLARLKIEYTTRLLDALFRKTGRIANKSAEDGGNHDVTMG